MKRGALIVLEGCDRCGKSTQCRKLIEELTRNNVTNALMSFPDRTTTIGELINKYLTKKIELPDKSVHLLFTANRWELEPKISNLLSNGTTIIVDRYSYSGVAFSAAKHGMDDKWCWQGEIGLPKPDLVLFLQVSAENAANRNDFGDERYETRQFQEAVYRQYQNMMDSNWRIINGNSEIDTVHKEIMTYVKETITAVVDEPIHRFM